MFVTQPLKNPLGGVPLLAIGVVDGDTVLGFGLDDLGKEYGL